MIDVDICSLDYFEHVVDCGLRFSEEVEGVSSITRPQPLETQSTEKLECERQASFVEYCVSSVDRANLTISLIN